MRVHNMSGTLGCGNKALNKTKLLILWDYIIAEEAENI